MIATYLNGELHSFNGLPALEGVSGDKLWYKYGKLHRRDLPAIECTNGTKHWYWDDKRHRDYDLPAIIYPDGTKEWYKHGILLIKN